MLRVARAELPAITADSVDVRHADNAFRDWRALGAVAELADRHLDMLARTAADAHAIAEIAVLSQQARAVQLALCDRPSR